MSNKAGKIGKHAFACVVMVLGCALVFTLLDVMNNLTEPPSEDDLDKKATLTVTKEKKPPKTLERRPKKRRPKKSSKPLAPIPTLGTSLTGNSFGIPSLAGLSLGEEADSLLVNEKALSSMVMTEDAVDVLPRPVMRKPPIYPARARQKGITGKVTLGILIGSTGEVLKVRVQESSPPGIFEDAAVTAVKGWQFEPAMYQGQSVKVWASQTVHFNIS
jgi:protein TonB